jgi:hypothetical protein
MHLGTAPATAALVIPLGPTRELRVTAGAGLGYARFSTGLRTLAITTEGSLGFVQRGRPGGPGLLVEAGLRLDQLEELNAGPGSELDGFGVINVQLPFVRAGVTWR